MRLVCLVTCAALAASSGSAFAASCNKGMLWPHVRTAGDCLTDAELAAGQTGVYSGPTNTNVDVSAIKPDPALNNNNAVLSSSSGNGLFEGSLFNGSLFSGGLFGGDSPPRPGVVACNKGFLWPFSREPGDCLTDEEKKQGHTGVYRQAEVVRASATTTAAAQPGATPGAPGATPAPTATASAPPAAPACHKGWLWPFVKSAGDCQSDGDKK